MGRQASLAEGMIAASGRRHLKRTWWLFPPVVVAGPLSPRGAHTRSTQSKQWPPPSSAAPGRTRPWPALPPPLGSASAGGVARAANADGPTPPQPEMTMGLSSRAPRTPSRRPSALAALAVDRPLQRIEPRSARAHKRCAEPPPVLAAPSLDGRGSYGRNSREESLWREKRREPYLFGCFHFSPCGFS